jgi:hypothetical protein
MEMVTHCPPESWPNWDKNMILIIDSFLDNQIKNCNSYIYLYYGLQANKEMALMWAARYGHIRRVKYVISLGAKVSSNNGIAIRNAALNGHLGIVKYLMSLKPKWSMNIATQQQIRNRGFNKVAQYLAWAAATEQEFDICHNCSVTGTGYKPSDREIIKQVLRDYGKL